MLAGPHPVFEASPTDPAAILAVLDAAIDEHAVWLHKWHRAIVTGSAPDRSVISDYAVFLCRFGSWIDLNRGQGLVDQKAFYDLDQSHTAMHAQARLLAECSAGGKRMPTADYDAFVESVERFNALARRMRDAFRKATSEIDPLTGLHNRHAMQRELQRECDLSVRHGIPFCIALADIDHFKHINDTHGHGVGDQVLNMIAGLFLMHVRPYDTVFRYGGEEFLVALPKADLAAAGSVLERLRAALEDSALALPDGHVLAVTASFGLTCVAPGLAPREAIEQADKALYAAKRNGRNCVVAWP